MKIDIVNGNVVTGDGKTFLENTSVVIENGLITDLPRMPYMPYRFYTNKVIDAHGGIVMPGLINIHAHAVCGGNPFIWAWDPLPEDRILSNLNTHLLQGTTTVLNLDGFVMPFENEAINKLHPINIKMTTLHTPKNIRAAELAGGRKLEEWRRNFTAEESVALGAINLGEVGSPGTSYGTYEKSIRLGRPFLAQDALALDDAFVNKDDEALSKAAKKAGLNMTIDEVKKFVKETSIDTIEAHNEAILETIEYVPKLGVPTSVHTEPAAMEALLEAAKALGPQLIATHVNHHFSTEELIKVAKEIKKTGAWIEVLTADFFSAKQIEADPKPTFALLEQDLGDVIITDYSGGYHDPILLLIKKAIEQRVTTLPKAIRMATSSPASIMPGLAPLKGLVEPGKVADIIIVDKDDITNVRYVIIAGRIVVEDGRIVA